jgi:hypothetical protein
MILFTHRPEDLRAELAAIRLARHTRAATIDATILRMWPSDASTSAIARVLDCRPETVRKRALALGLPRRVRKRGDDGLTPAQVDVFPLYRRKGFPSRDARAAALEAA